MADFKISTAIGAIDRISRPIRRISSVITTRLAGAFKSSARAARRATRAIGRTTSKLAKLGVAGASVAAGALARFTDQHAKAADSMAKLARRSGITIKAYQELRHAADLSGVSNESFDKGLVKFTRTIGEAKTGSGALAATLKKNAPEFLKQLKGTKSQTEALDLMLAAMGKIEDPTVRAALASAAFGRAGAEMTLIFENGAEGLADARKEAHDLGMVLDQTSATQAENYVDSMARLKGVLSGVGLTIGAALVPKLAAAADAGRDWVQANKGAISQKAENVWKAIGDAVSKVDFEAILEALTVVWDTLSPIVLEIFSAFRDNWEAIREVTIVVFGVIVGVMLAKLAILLALVKAFFANFSTVWNGIKLVLSGFLDFVVGVFTLDSAKAIGGLTKLWDGLKAWFSGLWGMIKDTFSTAFTAIDNLIVKFLPAPAVKAWEGLKTFFVDLWAGITSVFQKSVDKIFGWIDDIKGGVDTVLEAGDRVAAFLGGGVSASSAFAAGTAGGSASGSASVPSAAGRGSAVVLAGAGSSSTKSEVTVSFKNAPAELKVSAARTDGPGTVKTNVGRRQAGAGAP